MSDPFSSISGCSKYVLLWSKAEIQGTKSNHERTFKISACLYVQTSLWSKARHMDKPNRNWVGKYTLYALIGGMAKQTNKHIDRYIFFKNWQRIWNNDPNQKYRRQVIIAKTKPSFYHGYFRTIWYTKSAMY